MSHKGWPGRSAWVALGLACLVAAGGPRGALAEAAIFVSNFGSSEVTSGILGDDGAFEARGVTPAGAGSQPLAGAITPDGAFLYFANFGDAGVSMFTVRGDGRLEPGPRLNAPRADLSNASGIAIELEGSYLFVSYFNDGKAGAVAAFAIAEDGGLTLHGAVAATGGEGSAGVALTPDGRFLYVANMGSGTVSALAVSADGRLRALGAPEPSGKGALVLDVAPDGDYLYVANALDDTVSTFDVAADGTLRPVGVPVAAGGPGPRGVLAAPDGRSLYVAHYNTGHNGSRPGSVATFRLGADGRPTQLGEAVSTGGNGAEALALMPDGETLLVANFGSSDIAAFAVAADGALAKVGTPVPTGGVFPDFQSIVVVPNEDPNPASANARG